MIEYTEHSNNTKENDHTDGIYIEAIKEREFYING